MPKHLPKRKTKDSVFVDLFRDKKYLLELYQSLHPEEKNTTEDEIQNVTLHSVLVDASYNDLGFAVGDRMIILVESQSTWSVNIVLRMFFYAAWTYYEYFEERHVDFYTSRIIDTPKPELYVLYVGNRKNVPKELTFSGSFFDGEETAIEIKIKVLSQADDKNIIGQYITFCKIFDEQRKLYGYTEKTIQETIRICTDGNILKEYLESRRKEVVDIVMRLFDEQEVIRSHTERMMREAAREATERAHREDYEKTKKLAATMLEGGRIKTDEISLFFPELKEEDIEELKTTIVH